MHAHVQVANRHGAGRIAVIGPGEGQKPRSRAHALVQPELHGHLHRDLNGNRAGIGEEHAAQITRHARRQPPSQCERLLVDEPPQHDVRHQRELALDGLPDVGMVIAVAGRPPGCDPIDELAPVGEHDTAPLGAEHRERRASHLHLRIGQPDMGKPGPVPCGHLACRCAGFPARHSVLPFDGHCRHSALRQPTQGRCEDAFTR